MAEPVAGRLYRARKLLIFRWPVIHNPGQIFMFVGLLPDHCGNRDNKIKPCLLDEEGLLCFYAQGSSVDFDFFHFFEELSEASFTKKDAIAT